MDAVATAIAAWGHTMLAASYKSLTCAAFRRCFPSVNYALLTINLLRCCCFFLQPMDAVATAIAAWGHTVVLGDSWGQLGVWDTLSGRTTTMPSG